MATHPLDPQSPSQPTARRSLRESMNMGPPQRGPADEADDSWDSTPAKNEGELEQASAEESATILAALRDKPAEVDNPEEAAKLQSDNDELRSMIDEMRQQLEQLVGEGQAGFGEREREYEAMLEQKSETIRELHVRLQDLEKGGDAAGARADAVPANVNPDELANLSDEIERERCQLEQERRRLDEDRLQLREDEEAMMRQMREMEIQMAKERAELARQRNELQRLHSEIRHELELTTRDAAVNERLRMLTRRSKVDMPAASSSAEMPAASKKRTIIAAPSGDKGKKKEKGSGFFGRLFGK
jgi:chromosome segregation ATPase